MLDGGDKLEVYDINWVLNKDSKFKEVVNIDEKHIII